MRGFLNVGRMLPRFLLASVFTVVAAFATSLRAAVPLDYYLPPGTSYNSKVPSPEKFFGYQIGEWHLRSDQIVSYLQAVAAAAPERVKLQIAGYTHERKPLVVLTITSPANHARLEEIRTQHLDLFTPGKSDSLDVTRMPVIVDMGYSIHGNEPSGLNAMPVVVYHLAAAQDARVEQMLENAVVLVEANRNPDGGDRAAQWFNQHKSISAPSPDPADREHNEAWPRGRFNHYWFDPNRDWLPLVHPEAIVRAELFHRWRPNVLTDHHEMGTNSTFFFQPGVPTRNNPSIPARIVELTHKIAAHHQRALDGRGIFYYSEQGFDDFYPGKGSTYPDLHGTVGILYEQGSSRGHAQNSDNGLITFPFSIRNQVVTSFSTLEAAIALRTNLLTLQRDFHRLTAQLAAKSKTRAYVFGDDGDPGRAWALLDMLAKHRIEVRPLGAALSADGDKFEPGHAWVVLTDQPQHRLITEMFVRRTTFEDNIFYDVSAWTLPLALNLPFAELEAAPASKDPVAPQTPKGRLVGGHSDYAYLIDWRGYLAPRAVKRLQQAGIKVKGLTGGEVETVVADGSRATLAPGAVLVPVGMQSGKAAEIRQIIDVIVAEDAVTVYGVTTGLTPRGSDLGSASFVPLELPRVALIVGQGVDPQEAGAAWHVLDQRIELPPTLLDVAQLPRADLSRYNAIVMVDGSYDEIGDTTVASLKRWVREGGTLLVIGKAMQWAAKKEIAALEFGDARVRGPEGSVAARLPHASGADQEALKLVSGAIFAVSIDPTHPLGFGFNGERLFVCRANTIILKPAKSPYETPAVYTNTPLQSGYASEHNQRAIANSAAAVALPVGRGAVIALPDDPNFRGFWYGGNRLLFNALFYGSAIDPIRGGDGEAAELTPLGGDEPHTH